jgi:deoxyribodipyrimidine photo-lyase
MRILREATDDSGDCVIYVMSRDQRVQDNHALLAAQAEAIEHDLPLLVVFNLYRTLGYRRREHFSFMLEGLQHVEAGLKTINIPFVLTIGSMTENVATIAKTTRPRTIYFDFSPLRQARRTKEQLAAAVTCRVVVVDTHNIVPVWVASDKEEFAAHTIRRKLHRLIDDWTIEPEPLKKHPYTFKNIPSGASWSEAAEVIQALPASGIRPDFESGEAAASATLTRFIETGLTRYAHARNDPMANAQSNLSPYLHFGQVSSLRVLLELLKVSEQPPQLFSSFTMPSYEGTATQQDGIDSFVEELVVRKELSDNFCFYNTNYDTLQGARDWAKKTLKDHQSDPREATYSKQQLERAETHDELWNAAQLQLTKSGKIHGYMRMYWAKKLLEWTSSPDEAVAIAIELNDTYHLDGGDPNGYVGILWSIAGVHDRPWFNRSVFGTVRYMAQSGANKKFDTARYIEQWR